MKIARSVIAAFASLMLGGAALAEPLLKADVVVSAAVVTVGDMFGDAGLAAETPLFRAPQPGTSGMVDLSDIEAALARVGIVRFDAAGHQAVRVTRAATVVDEAMLTELVSADLARRGILTQGMSADVQFATAVAPINAEAVAEPASVVSLRYLPGTGAFTARVVLAGVAQPLDLSGTIELMMSVPHLTATLPAGAVLKATDIEFRDVPLRFAESTGVAQLDQLIGKALVRQSRDGMMLKPADVTTPLLIGKNDLVTIYFRKGPLTLTVKGQAITGAASGAPLQVLNLMSRRVINATAIAAGAVEVSAEPLTLAGL